MRYAPHASRYSLFALAVSAALLPGARGGAPPAPPRAPPPPPPPGAGDPPAPG
ncbi:hypothetical protein [Pseudomonas aeruginosa]|uniref:hypothetical protein n=1 Tax=Pseudomonas aeruginosa TaxID=287 RepID=UPI0021F0EAAE|nr:hypothetical protein [Pseudomonas aeruginosa]MCV6105435.1 hypothetical protein [Pseudomonas aeruginosa]